MSPLGLRRLYPDQCWLPHWWCTGLLRALWGGAGWRREVKMVHSHTVTCTLLIMWTGTLRPLWMYRPFQGWLCIYNIIPKLKFTNNMFIFTFLGTTSSKAVPRLRRAPSSWGVAPSSLWRKPSDHCMMPLWLYAEPSRCAIDQNLWNVLIGSKMFSCLLSPNLKSFDYRMTQLWLEVVL